ncbi:MAG: undecaprenyl-diphosphatase UppP [Porphyromonas sp.]|nr:undecaprenyl-diphosphatase UppP [Porphyromonas sp.]
MSRLEALILAIIEGLTEFLPISSTGHLVVAQGLMGMDSTAFVRAFTVMIQFGAILSVVVLYRDKFFPISAKGSSQPSSVKYANLGHFYLKLLVGIIPAVVLGFLFNDWVDRILGDIFVVIANLFIGGVAMLFIDKISFRKSGDEVSYKQALFVGLWQCIAIFLPGISRSMATIVGGLFSGLTKKSAAEFSFFLAVPTMFGATLLQAYKLYKEFGMQVFVDNADTLIIGNVVSFIVAMLAIKFFVSYITRKGFAIFGVYRILFAFAMGVLVLWNLFSMV